MVDIVRVIIVSVKHAAFVEAFHQHAFPVQIAEAKRSVHFIHALFFRPVFYNIKKCPGHSSVIYKVHL